MQMQKLTKIPPEIFKDAYNYRPISRKKKPIIILHGIKPMTDVSTSKLTFCINKSVKFMRKITTFFKNIFN